MNLIEAFTTNCRQATLLYEKKSAGKISAMERFGLWFHLLYCKFCRLFVKQSNLIEGYVKRLAGNTGKPFQLSSSIKADMQQKLGAELKRD